MPLLIICIVSIAGLVVADQCVKLYFISLHSFFDFPVIGDYVRFTYTENRGAAFGIFQNSRVFLIGITSVLVLCCLYFIVFRKLSSVIANISLALIVAGGIGNLIDRVFRGYVVDFIYFKFIHFAVFNMADSYVFIGAVMMCLYVLFRESAGKGKRGEA